MKKLSFHILISSVISITGSIAIACGGVSDVTDDKIISLSFVQAVQAEIANVHGEAVEIESIIPSGNSILTLDKKIAARARCSANYINVYMKPQASENFICMTVFQINPRGQIDFSGLKPGVACRRAGENQIQFIPVAGNK